MDEWLNIILEYKDAIATFLSVLFAFGLEHLWEWHRDNESRSEVIKDILAELKECLERQLSNRMPVVVWQAVVNSGKEMLLDNKKLDRCEVDLI